MVDCVGKGGCVEALGQKESKLKLLDSIWNIACRIRKGGSQQWMGGKKRIIYQSYA